MIRYITSISPTVFLLSTFLFFGGCTKDSNQQAETSQNQAESVMSAGFLEFKNDFITTKYPAHWKVVFSGKEDFTENKVMIFRLSEVSSISVTEFADNTSYSTLANDYEKRLNLLSSSEIEDYQRTNFTIKGASGLKLTWTKRGMFTSKVEVYIVRLGDFSQNTIAVVDLDEMDLERERKQVLYFIENIKES